jgi:hypothetical protein
VLCVREVNPERAKDVLAKVRGPAPRATRVVRQCSKNTPLVQGADFTMTTTRAERDSDNIEVFVAYYRGETRKQIASRMGIKSRGLVQCKIDNGMSVLWRTYESTKTEFGFESLMKTSLAGIRIKVQ